MNNEIEWAVYYGDGNTYTNLTGAVENTPVWDVQVIVYRDNDRGWFTQTGTKYYVWDNRGEGYRWYGADDVGMLDYLQTPGWKRVLIGRTIPNARFMEIFNRAKNDFGEKGSFYRWERRP